MAEDEKAESLTLASAALEKELARSAELARAARKIPLNSEKNIERASRALTEAAKSHEQAGQYVFALVAAVARARQLQEATASEIHAQATEVQRRIAQLGVLARRFAELGKEANAIGSMVQEAINARRESKGTAGPGAAPLLEEVHARMARVLEGATELTLAAKTDGLVDVARDADAIRQQVQAARNKLTLLQGK